MKDKRAIYFKKLHKYFLRIKQKIKRNDDCIIWEGAHDTSGYGRIWIRRNKKRSYIKVHRVTYAYKKKITLKELEKYHLGNDDETCGNNDCVNPEHWSILREVPLDIDRRPKRAARAGRGKKTVLQIDEVIRIRKLIAKNVPTRKIANKFNVEMARIYRIRDREIFKHVK